jgi:predicted RNase H-like HicB family nuclease
MLVGIFDARPGPCRPKHPWRESFAAIRVALRAAEKLTGRERTHALVRVCRAFERADGDDAPGWRINSKGEGVRTENAETRAFDRANRALDRRIHDAVGRCLSCFSMENELPEDSLIDLITDEEAGRLRGRRTKLAEVEKKTGIAFERSEGWWVVSIWGVPGAHTQGRSLRAAFTSLQTVLEDFEQMHRDGRAWGPSGPFPARLSANNRAVIARTLAITLPPPSRQRRARATPRAANRSKAPAPARARRRRAP